MGIEGVGVIKLLLPPDSRVGWDPATNPRASYANTPKNNRCGADFRMIKKGGGGLDYM